MRMKSKIVLVCVLIACVVCVFAYSLYMRTHYLCLQVHKLADMLRLFIGEYGRMPNDLEELYETGYLIRTPHGPGYGPSVLRLYEGYDPNTRGFVFRDFSLFRINYRAPGNDEPALKFVGHGPASRLARERSTGISKMLAENTRNGE